MVLFAAVALAASLPSVDRPLHTGASDPRDAAVVIGIEDYAMDGMPDVPFAEADAAAVWGWMVYTRGIPASRVRRLTGTVSNGQIARAVTELGAKVQAGGTLFVYFAGHGAASPTTRERLLLGSDTEPTADSFDSRGIVVSEVRRLGGVGGGRVVLVVDACYGGYGRDGNPKAEGRWVVPTAGGAGEWVGASVNEVATALPETRHGLFTYLFLGAMRGWADGEVDGIQDGRVTGVEADSFVRRTAVLLGRGRQTPEMSPELAAFEFATETTEKSPPILSRSATREPGSVVTLTPFAGYQINFLTEGDPGSDSEPSDQFSDGAAGGLSLVWLGPRGLGVGLMVGASHYEGVIDTANSNGGVLGHLNHKDIEVFMQTTLDLAVVARLQSARGAYTFDVAPTAHVSVDDRNSFNPMGVYSDGTYTRFNDGSQAIGSGASLAVGVAVQPFERVPVGMRINVELGFSVIEVDDDGGLFATPNVRAAAGVEFPFDLALSG